MASRSLLDLRPEVRGKATEHVARCAARGVELLVYCTLRSPREQAQEFAKARGRAEIVAKANEMLSTYGRADLADLLRVQAPVSAQRIATKAGPGESLHQHGLAYDCVPVVNGRLAWGTSGADLALWRIVGEEGQRLGLEWAGSWTGFREFPHFQAPGKKLRELIAAMPPLT